MQLQRFTHGVILFAMMFCSVAFVAAADDPAPEATTEASIESTAEAAGEPAATLGDAFEALKTFDWGTDLAVVQPIEDAIIADHANEARLADLEVRLTEVLSTDASPDAKGYVCRKLRVIGTKESVPALSALLTDKDLSHMARYALQRMSAPEAAEALREALPKVDGKLKMGVIGSIGAKRDAEAIQELAKLLDDDDEGIASEAAAALGLIGTPESARILKNFLKGAPEGVKESVTDALLINAEKLLADGKKPQAMLVYKSLAGEDQPKNVRLAATRGLLAVAGKKDDAEKSSQ